MWHELVDWASRNTLCDGFEIAGPEEMEIPRCVSTVEEAIEVVRPHHEARERRQHY